MADDADRAEVIIEQVADDALAEVRRAMVHGLTYTGFCHYCGDITGGGRRFCCADCRDDYDHEKQLKRMQGVK